MCAQPYMVERVKQETIMRNIILTLAGAALIAGSTSQVAFSKERHHTARAPTVTATITELR